MRFFFGKYLTYKIIIFISNEVFYKIPVCLLFPALFASVCLASRLMTSYEAFVLLAISVVAFVLFPIFRLKLNGILLCFVTILTVICVVFLTAYYCSLKVSLCASVAIIIVTGVCPALFLHWQNFKHTIHGPWDEAVPNIQ